MRKNWKKLISWMLALALLLSIGAGMAYAEETETSEPQIAVTEASETDAAVPETEEPVSDLPVITAVISEESAETAQENEISAPVAEETPEPEETTHTPSPVAEGAEAPADEQPNEQTLDELLTGEDSIYEIVLEELVENLLGEEPSVTIPPVVTGDDFIPIGTAEEFKKIGTDSNYPLSGKYRLTADITMDQMIAGTFSGVFDGNGYTVTLNVTASAYNAGLFQELSGTIENLTTDGVFTNTETGGQTGAIVGALSGGTILQCWNQATVTRAYGWNTEGTAGIAGMIGGGTIANCLNTGTISITNAEKRKGGIANSNTAAFTIANCCSSFCPEVDGYYIVGGELQNYGSPTTKTISSCYYFGDSDRAGESHDWRSTVQGESHRLTGSAITNPDSYVGWDFENLWTMGASGPELVLPHLYYINVAGGTASKAWASVGESVTVTADVPSGQRFAEWTGANGLTFTAGSAKSAEATFTVADNAALTAVCVAEDAHYHDGIEYTAWESTSSLPTTAGSYYLTADVTIGSRWDVPSGTVNLCLNGHSITRTGASGTTGSVIQVGSGATLNLYDCGTETRYYTVANPEANGAGLGTVVDESTYNAASETARGTFTGGYITGGNITGGADANHLIGGGVNVVSGTFTMYGGTIFGNRVCINGGGVKVKGAGASFTMNGGAILANYNDCYGGAISVGDNGSNRLCTVTINGGTIAHNWSGRNGGALHLDSYNHTFTITGGTIINNHTDGGFMNGTSYSAGRAGGGVLKDGVALKLSGAPVFSANSNKGYPENNLNLMGGKTDLIDLFGHLTDGADIGVYVSGWSNPTSADYRIATGAQMSDVQYIHYDIPSEATIVYCDGAKDWAYLNGAFVEYGGTHHTHAGGTVWATASTPAALVITGDTTLTYGSIDDALSAWTDGSTLKLCSDVTTTSAINFSGTKTLDLNGFGIRYAGSGKGSVLISSSQNGNSSAANLTIIDSNPSAIHKITLTAYRGTAVETVASAGATSVDESGNGTVYVRGGYLTGGTGTLLSGSIYIGGAIYMRGANKTVTMNGGAIVGNACSFGGSLHISNGTFTLNGGQVIYNSGNGAAFNMDDNSKLYLYGGEIAHNTSGIRFAVGGGGVLTLANSTGSTAISDNKEYGIWLNNGKTIAIGGALTNTAPIGVTLGSTTGTFTSGWSTYMGEADPADYFTSDNASYGIYLSGEEAIIRLPAVPAPTPTATFTATGPDSGTLTNVASGMQYSVDGGTTWTAITETSVAITGVTAANGVKVYTIGNGTTTLDSEVQTITVTKAAKPSLTVTQPETGDTGSVNATESHEYRADDGASWTVCTENQSLAVGCYLVRVKASGTALASDAQIVTITKAVSGSGDGGTSYFVDGKTVTTELNVGDSTPAVKVKNLDLEATVQSAAAEAGAQVKLAMSVEAKPAANVAKADAFVAAVSDVTTLEYLEITVNKTVGSSAETLTETQNVLEIIVPYKFKGKDSVAVYRYHDGAAKALTQADTKKDGTYRLDEENIYIYASEFSTYAVSFIQCFNVTGAIQYGSFAGDIQLSILDMDKNPVPGKAMTLSGSTWNYCFTHIQKGKYYLRATWTEAGLPHTIEKPIEIN